MESEKPAEGRSERRPPFPLFISHLQPRRGKEQASTRSTWTSVNVATRVQTSSHLLRLTLTRCILPDSFAVVRHVHRLAQTPTC